MRYYTWNLERTMFRNCCASLQGQTSHSDGGPYKSRAMAENTLARVIRTCREAGAEILSQEIRTHEGEPGGFSDYSFPERLQSIPMRSIRVYFADGQTLETSINGSEVEIAEYYVGKEFNLGRGGDDYVTRAIEVEFLPSDI